MLLTSVGMFPPKVFFSCLCNGVFFGGNKLYKNYKIVHDGNRGVRLRIFN